MADKDSREIVTEIPKKAASLLEKCKLKGNTVIIGTLAEKVSHDMSVIGSREAAVAKLLINQFNAIKPKTPPVDISSLISELRKETLSPKFNGPGNQLHNLIGENPVLKTIASHLQGVISSRNLMTAAVELSDDFLTTNSQIVPDNSCVRAIDVLGLENPNRGLVQDVLRDAIGIAATSTRRHYEFKEELGKLQDSSDAIRSLEQIESELAEKKD